MFPSASASLLFLSSCLHVVSCIAVPALPAPSTRSGESNAACPAPDYHPCGGGLPDGFCCEAGTTCLVLAANTTGLCCPAGGDCERIRPVTCDLQAQNVTAYPESPILTTGLAGELPRCGNDGSGASTCCPFGYVCGDGSICVLDGEQTTASSSTRPLAPTSASGPLTPTAPAALATSSTTSTTASLASTPSASPPPASPATPTLSGSGDPFATGRQPPSASAQATHAAGIIAGSAAAGLVSLIGLAVLVWKGQRRLARLLRRGGPRPGPPSGWGSASLRTSAAALPSPTVSSYPLGPVGARKGGAAPFLSPGSPVELPATPLSFSFWTRRSVRASRQQPALGPVRDESERV